MSKNKILEVVILSAALVAAAEQSHAACTKPSFTVEEKKVIPTGSIDQRTLSRAFTKQTNYYRCLRGLKPLDDDPQMVAASKIHSYNMARLNRLSHTLPVAGATTISDRFNRANVQSDTIRTENVGTEYRMVFGTGVFLIQDKRNCRFVYNDTREKIPVHTYGSFAESAVRNLWNSYSHRLNILNRRVERVGASAYFTIHGPAPCGTYYYTQNFAG